MVGIQPPVGQQYQKNRDGIKREPFAGGISTGINGHPGWMHHSFVHALILPFLGNVYDNEKENCVQEIGGGKDTRQSFEKVLHIREKGKGKPEYDN